MSDGFRPDLKDRARRDFYRARRFEGKQTARSEFNARVLNAKTEKIHRIRQKLTVHIGKNKERWMQAEMTRLQKAKPHKASHSLADGPKAPFGLSYKGPSHNRSLREQARANVEHRCEMRQRGLDRAEHRLTRKLNRTHKQT
ncbi:MAG: hypothetical protein AAFQ04_10270 [Pseudomonadota bacterium]